MKEFDFEKVIIKALLTNDKVKTKVLPFLKEEWFGFNIDAKDIVRKIISYNSKYSEMANPLEIERMISNDSTLKTFKDILSIPNENVETPYIIEEIEEFVRRKLIYNVSERMHEYCRGENQEDNFADEVAEAQAFSFNTDIGFSFFEDPQILFEDIIANEKVYSTGLKSIDDLIGGGLHEKSLNMIMAPTNVGKTLTLCSIATNLIINGHTVLYVTFEDSEKKIGQRIAQNLYDVTQTQLKSLSRNSYGSIYKKALAKCGHNKLIIKEYEEGTLNAIGLKALLKELEEKKNFIPEVLIIDYIGCMIPNGKVSINTNDNTILKLVSGQVRSIGMIKGIPIVSAMQTNRGGYQSADLGLDDAADSFGQTMKADAIFGIMQSPEMKEANMYTVKLLKTRYGNKRGNVVTIGVDVEKQRLFDLVGYKPQNTGNGQQSASPSDIIASQADEAMSNVVNDFE